MSVSEQDPEDGGGVRRGCLAATIMVFALAFALMLLSHHVIPRFVTVEAPEMARLDRYLLFAAWLLSVAFGGYIAAKRSPTWFRNAFWVGGVALFVLITRLPRHAATPDGDLFDDIATIIKDPRPHAERLIFMSLVLPSALFGGFLASRAGSHSATAEKA